MTDLNAIKPFWMVYGIGQRAPAYQHGSERSAQDEAERLARQAPGVTFVVLEARHAVRLRDLDRFDLRTAPHPRAGPRAEDDDIPF